VEKRPAEAVPRAPDKRLKQAEKFQDDHDNDDHTDDVEDAPVHIRRNNTLLPPRRLEISSTSSEFGTRWSGIASFSVLRGGDPCDDKRRALIALASSQGAEKTQLAHFVFPAKIVANAGEIARARARESRRDFLLLRRFEKLLRR
jgi:hypothetical protein